MKLHDRTLRWLSKQARILDADCAALAKDQTTDDARREYAWKDELRMDMIMIGAHGTLASLATRFDVCEVMGNEIDALITNAPLPQDANEHAGLLSDLQDEQEAVLMYQRMIATIEMVEIARRQVQFITRDIDLSNPRLGGNFIGNVMTACAGDLHRIEKRTRKMIECWASHGDACKQQDKGA